MTKLTRRFAVPALLAALSLTATPVAAAELPTTTHYAPAQASSYHGGWGWGGRHRYRHRSRTSAGDVIGAVLVLGTIAAVASAASKANRERGYPYPDRYPRPYPDRRGEYRPDTPRGIEGAADLCLREIERDARVDDVTRVERSASGWLVTGAMADGTGFTCSIGADGRIDRIEVGGRTRTLGEYEARSESGSERYRGAEVEAEARADDAPLRDYPSADSDVESGPQPDYPGGPLPGDADEDGGEPGS